MVKKNAWRANPPAIVVVGGATFGVLAYCYRSAVDWFTLRAAARMADGAVALPMTGMGEEALKPGFPWWALLATFTVALATIVIWRSGYVSLRESLRQAIGRWAGAKARAFGIKAEVYRRVAAESGKASSSRRIEAYARAAVAFNSLSRRLLGVGATTPRSSATHVAAPETPRREARPRPVTTATSVNRTTIPPRFDSLGGGMPPRRPNPIREGSWALSHSVELTGA